MTIVQLRRLSFSRKLRLRARTEQDNYQGD